jgi:hypothetical protein
MSVLHQQRIRIAASYQWGDPWSTSDKTLAAWATYCPSCLTGAELPTWTEALAWAYQHLNEAHCRYCIDRQMPAGRDRLLGELFERCPVCAAECAVCCGISVYPASYDTPTELVEDLATVRLTPVFCDGCNGVLAVVPLDPEVPA